MSRYVLEYSDTGWCIVDTLGEECKFTEEKAVELLNLQYEMLQEAVEENVGLGWVNRQQAQFLKAKGYSLKEFLEFVGDDVPEGKG